MPDEDNLNKGDELEDQEIDHEDELDSLDNDSKYKKLQKSEMKWRLRAKENKEAAKIAEEAKKEAKELKDQISKLTDNVEKRNQLADKRLIDAEIKLLATEYGLKKLEYAKLGEGYNKLTVSESGEVVGSREMIEKLKKSDPDLFKSATTTNTNFQGDVSKGHVQAEKKVLKLSKQEYDKEKREFLRKSR